jgi:hypothetical protein
MRRRNIKNQMQKGNDWEALVPGRLRREPTGHQDALGGGHVRQGLMDSARHVVNRISTLVS